MAGVADITSKMLLDRDPSFMDLNANDIHTTSSSRKAYSNTGFEPLEVRDVVCVAGANRDDIVWVKNRLAQLTVKPQQLEGFQIRHASDLDDGAFLVPKIALVATHYPGKKLVDDDGNDGQIDALYDQACDAAADAIVIYIGLPSRVYPPVKDELFHPKMAKTLFPAQPALEDLTENDCLITVTEGSDFNSAQRRLLRHWLAKPVDKYHPVYERAAELRQKRLESASSANTDSTGVVMPPEHIELKKY